MVNEGFEAFWSQSPKQLWRLNRGGSDRRHKLFFPWRGGTLVSQQRTILAVLGGRCWTALDALWAGWVHRSASSAQHASHWLVNVLQTVRFRTMKHVFVWLTTQARHHRSIFRWGAFSLPPSPTTCDSRPGRCIYIPFRQGVVLTDLKSLLDCQ